jgi:hypothetical protein
MFSALTTCERQLLEVDVNRPEFLSDSADVRVDR